MTLDDLALKYGTDKGSTGHFYTRHYEKIFSSIRMDIECILEVGVGAGQSLKMWRDYFPSALIYGVDQNRIEDGLGDRIEVLGCEQTNHETLVSEFKDKGLQFIVDDASHDPGNTMKTLNALWPTLERNGWYVIEDMDKNLFPEVIGRWYGEQHREIRQLQILSNKDRGSAIIFIQKQ